MSGLAGVYWLDSARHGAAGDVRGPLVNLRHRGPDGLYAHASGPCVLGIAHHITTPEARMERQPYVTGRGLVMTLDGRIDNTDDLRRSLGTTRSDAPSDVSVLGAAWERWGSDTLERALGDFALAVWDPQARCLSLARDVFGLRPLFYRSYSGGLWWASELQALARLGDARVNEGMAAEYLAERVTSETECLVSGVMRVPRASGLVVNSSGRRQWRYWTPAVSVTESRGDEDAVEQFRELFTASVRARTRSPGPVALMLSGGLDSSLIGATINRLSQSGASAALETFSTAWPHSPADESGFAVAVTEHLRLRGTVCSGEHAQAAEYEADAARALDLPESPNSRIAHPLRDTIRTRQFGTVLNGLGGDEWFAGNQLAIADDLRSGRWIRAARAINERRHDGCLWPNDVRLALWTQLSSTTKRRIRAWRGLRATPSWIRREFADSIELESRLRAAAIPPTLPSYEAQQMFSWATSGDAMFLAEHNERIDASYGLEGRAPFYDRRLVEWALTLPQRQRRRDGLSKWVLRQVAAQELPSVVQQRRQSPDFSFLTAEALHRLGGHALVRRIATRREGWVDPTAIDHLWSEMCVAETTRRRLGVSSWILWLLVATDLAASAIERLPRDGQRLAAAEADSKLEPV